MKFDTVIAAHDFIGIRDFARWAESIGHDGLWSIETAHEPFMPLAIAATDTQRVTLGTAIAVAFPRNPTVLAHTCWDLQANSNGRFILGLGTQVKGHNERRYGVPFVAPVKKLREMILAMRAVWDCWQNDTPLRFEGEFYRLTMMTPFFSPPKIAHPKIPIYVAGVNRLIAEMVGEVCDGFHVHPLNSPRFLRESLIPSIEKGAQRAGRSRQAITLSTQALVATGDSTEAITAQREDIRRQIGFYASTRTYAPVLETHGWGEVSGKLSAKAAAGDWAGMAREVTDEMLDEFCISGPIDEIGKKLRARYDGLLDRVSLYLPFRPGENDAGLKRIITDIHA
ncbi:MAG: TIGR03617 family F420-dependent LLM class oxidoreductase [Candidatus Binatia bacterium]